MRERKGKREVRDTENGGGNEGCGARDGTGKRVSEGVESTAREVWREA